MRSTITTRGQTVIPAEIRRRFQLDPSKKLEWIVDRNGIKVVSVKPTRLTRSAFTALLDGHIVLTR